MGLFCHMNRSLLPNNYVLLARQVGPSWQINGSGFTHTHTHTPSLAVARRRAKFVVFIPTSTLKKKRERKKKKEKKRKVCRVHPYLHIEEKRKKEKKKKICRVHPYLHTEEKKIAIFHQWFAAHWNIVIVNTYTLCASSPPHCVRV